MIINSNTSAIASTTRTQKVAQTVAYEQTQPIQKTDKLSQMQEKYQEIYTPMPETYTKGSEELQKQKIYEAYPNYVPAQELLPEVSRIYTEEFGEKKIELGDPPLNEEQKKKYEAAFERVFEPYGGVEAYGVMYKGVLEIQKQYPINQWGKDGLDNAGELARFYNAGVYEGLEAGKSLSEAQKSVSEAIFEYMGTSVNKTLLKSMPNQILGIRGSELLNDYVYYEKSEYHYESSIDLRDFGIEGAWWDNDTYKSDTSMISEIYKKLEQFDFMLNNPDLIDKANEKLKPFYQEKCKDMKKS